MRRRLIPPPNPPIQLSGGVGGGAREGETTVQEAHRVRKVQSSTSSIAPPPPRSLHCLPRQNTPFLLSLMLVSLPPPILEQESFSLQIQKSLPSNLSKTRSQERPHGRYQPWRRQTGLLGACFRRGRSISRAGGWLP